MKIKEIKLNALINIGPYSHVTMDVTGELSEGESALEILENFKGRVEQIMQGVPVGKNLSYSEVQPVAEAPAVEKVEAEPVEKPKRGRKPKEEKKEEAPVEEAPQVEEKKPEAKKIAAISYDSTIPEHKSIFGGYLNKKYGNTWKTAKPVEEIKSFTAELNGQDFIDADGHIVESFLGKVHDFFGA